ncbi:ParD-like family protein [Desulfotignum balticum]|jgi:transcription elongation factor GreA-like protein|uniref:ParD-like family protein n=1 Tax=Desulfotignum balticum TaxID=115781 RepID=UPI0004186018|nr:ParD-like family protein [Desulfotignum balticum]
MATAVKVSDELFEKAKTKSKVYKRSIAGQIEYWAKIGQLIEENPDLPLSFIQDILEGKEQIKAGQGCQIDLSTSRHRGCQNRGFTGCPGI